MQRPLQIYIISALCLLLATLAFGLVSTWAFLYPETYNRFLPFYQLRPFHVSAALFWIISGATSSILYYKNDTIIKGKQHKSLIESIFIYTWLGTIAVVFLCYGFKKFGGREYWEFPPVLSVPLLIAWILLMVSYFPPLLKYAGKKPMYIWMWTTGIFFFLITFIEQNLWQVPWFRESYLREITVQWKANGSMVGAWNQMIYGTSLYLMVKISGDEKMAISKTAFFFYMLGLTNLMFNWGHHIYNVPTASWIRDSAYFISMTEWIFLIRMIAHFRKTLDERRKLKHLITYRFIIAAEFWVFMNLLLTLSMSVPAINRYTHGTHITVAHAMGATIGINSMILLASFSYMLGIEQQTQRIKKIVSVNYWITQYSFALFWLSLIAAGIIKSYLSTGSTSYTFQEIMLEVTPAIKSLSVAGFVMAISMGTIAVILIRQAFVRKKFNSEIKQNQRVISPELFRKDKILTFER